MTSPKMGSNQVRSGDLELELPDTMVGEPSDEAKKPFEEIQIEQFGISPKNRFPTSLLKQLLTQRNLLPQISSLPRRIRII